MQLKPPLSPFEKIKELEGMNDFMSDNQYENLFKDSELGNSSHILAKLK